MQKKNIIRILMLCAMFGVLWYEIFILRGEDFYYSAIGIIVIGLLGFLLSFENSKPSVALLTMMAALCGIAIASRIAFFFLPQVKPIAAIVIIIGLAFGAEAGFVSGAVSAFVSNFYFGQGSFTVFQMFALGLVGFVAGLLFSKKKNRIAVSIYGFFSVIILYGGIVDINSIFFTAADPTPEVVAAVYLAGVPFNAIFGLSTAIFLFLLYQPILRRLEHIQKKYRFIDK